MEWVTQQTKECMNLSLMPPLMSQVSGFQGEGLWSFPGKKIKLKKIDLISKSLRERGGGDTSSWETFKSIRSHGERILQCSRAVSVSIPPHLALSPRVPLPEVTGSINTSGGSSRQAPFSYRDGSSGKSKGTIILFSYSSVPSGIPPDVGFSRCYVKCNLVYIPQGAAFSWIKTDETRGKTKCKLTLRFSHKASDVPSSFPWRRKSKFLLLVEENWVCVCFCVFVCTRCAYVCVSPAWGHFHRWRLYDRWCCSPRHNECNCQIRIQPTTALMISWKGVFRRAGVGCVEVKSQFWSTRSQKPGWKTHERSPPQATAVILFSIK